MNTTIPTPTKPQEADKPQPPTAQKQASAPRMKGWLIVFFVLELMVMLLAMVGTASKAHPTGVTLSLLYEWLRPLFDVCVILFGLYGFIKRRPDAHFAILFYVSYSFLSTALGGLMTGLKGTLSDEDMLSTVLYMVFGVVYNGLWLIYFSLSRQVERLIPKESRRFTPALYFIAIAYSIQLMILIF